MKKLSGIHLTTSEVFFKRIHELYDLCMHAREDSEESVNKLRQWLLCNIENKKRFHAAATYRGYDNMTPLHLMLGRRLPLDVIEILIKHAPEALGMKNCNGKLPLHLACRFGASLQVLDLLISAYPESIHVLDTNDKKPSQLLEMSTTSGEYCDKDTRFLLHNAVSSTKLSVHLVLLLLQAFPKSCKIQDKNGRIPLHYACENASQNSAMGTLMALSDAYPQSFTTVQDNQGKTPSQLLTQFASYKDPSNSYMLPLHRQASSSRLSAHLLCLLFSAYPESIASPDKRGMLPFHYACLNEASTIEILMIFLKLYPESILFNNDITS